MAQLPLGIEIEQNPWRADIPDQIRDINEKLYEYLKENATNLREQHNVTHAGDTTFHWHELTKIGTTRQYTLGSVGTFLHPDYGLIYAQYAQFSTPISEQVPGIPVGLEIPVNPMGKVTADFAKSSLNVLVGISGPYVSPAQDNYGWVICQGINIQSVRVKSAIEPSANDRLSWDSSGYLGISGSGTTIGFVLTAEGASLVAEGVWEFPPASILIKLEVNSSGGGGYTFANRPVLSNSSIGFQFFCLDRGPNGRPLWYAGNGNWVDADGYVVT